MNTPKRSTRSRKKTNRARLPKGSVGAFGERTVEAELLRHGWIPANFNHTVKNAEGYDIAAQKDGKLVLISVKTCYAAKSFQFRILKKKTLQLNHFTVLVEMGSARGEDRFFIVPTTKILREVEGRRRTILSKPKRDGTAVKDIGMWVLRIKAPQRGRTRAGWDLGQKFREYVDVWDVLDRPVG